MSTIDSLRNEFEHETATTRRHLERLPDDKLAWQPHEKSFSAGGLASHIVECVRWADAIVSADEFDVNPAVFQAYSASSVADLLENFDQAVARGATALARADEATLARPWRLKVMGRVRFERPKADVFRDFTLSHLIHHRGQFAVYLRLMNVPVPGSYGPTADEQVAMPA
jgi:uncharacterized damage-inducible protein DinB